MTREPTPDPDPKRKPKEGPPSHDWLVRKAEEEDRSQSVAAGGHESDIDEKQVFFKFQVGKVIAAAPLLVALLDLPYGYYTFLRLWTCPLAIVAAWLCFSTNKFRFLGIVFAVVALIFNPLVIVSFERETWQVIDFIVAGIFCFIPLPQNEKLKEWLS